MRRLLLPLPPTFGLVILLGLLGWLRLDAARAASQARALAPAAPASDRSAVIAAAAAYLHSQQQPDGGIDGFGFGGGADPGSTARTVLALAAVGYPADSLVYTATGKTLLDYLAAHAYTYTHAAGGQLFPAQAGLLLSAVSAAGLDPAGFAGLDLVSELEAAFHPASGAYSTTASQGWNSGAASDLNQGWAILGLATAGRDIPPGAAQYLVDSQAADGSWAFGSLDTSALILLTLHTGGGLPAEHPALQRAIDYFRQAQLPSGGWRPDWDSDPLNVNTTAWIIQALQAAGHTPLAPGWTQPGGDPQQALLSLARPDGSIGGTYLNAYSTAEALFGLVERPLFTLGPGSAARRGLTWLKSLQKPDGSWPDLFSPAGATADVVLAFSAAGYDPFTLRLTDTAPSVMDYLAGQAAAFSQRSAAAAGKLTLAAAGAGADVRSFGGVDLVSVLTATHFNPALGAFGIVTNTWDQAFAVLGLAAAGETLPLSATQALTSLQQADGGWKYDLGPYSAVSDPDSTGLAMQALAAAGLPADHPSLAAAKAYLRLQQDGQAGWGSANSTAFAIQGLLAAGEDVRRDWRVQGRTPLAALAAYQKSDGPFVYQFDSPWVLPNDDSFATRQAIPALLGVPFPLNPAGLQLFQPAQPAPDPDRLVILPPFAAWNGAATVFLPFGSDLNRSGSASFSWRLPGAAAWTAGPAVQRGAGTFTATLPLTMPQVVEVRADYVDPNGVQAGQLLTGSLSIESRLAPPAWIVLPILLR
jgi:hypothetical protein